MITRRDLLQRFATLTGSVAFGVAGHKSDEDWLISLENLKRIGVRRNFPVADFYPDGFRSIREGNINLVVYFDRYFCDKWMKAHHHCCIERPRDRKRRIKIFRHYLYGETL